MNRLFFNLIILSFSSSGLAQKNVTISGKIEGVGNSMIYLGNKPNGISDGFHYIIYDSVLSKGDWFEFKSFKFNESGFYSIQVQGFETWLTFVIDTGKIVINAKKDSIYKGIVSGSAENKLYQLYRNKVLIPYSIAMRSDYDSLHKYQDLDLTKYDVYSDKIKKNQNIFLSQKKNFIRNHPSNYISLVILKQTQRQIPVDSLHYYYNLLSPELQNNSRAADLRHWIDNFSEDNLTVEIKDCKLFVISHYMNRGLKEQELTVEKMKIWCREAEKTHTPTIFINGKRLPENYKIEELKYIL